MAVIKHVRKAKNSKKRTVFYEAQVYVRGVRVTIKTFETRAEAGVWHDQTKRQFLARESHTPAVDEYRFDDLLREYETDVLPRRRKSTRQTFEGRLRHFRGSAVNTLRMSEFGPSAVDQFIDWWMRPPTSKRACRRNFRHELKLLLAILNWYRNNKNAAYVVPVVKHLGGLERITWKHIGIKKHEDTFLGFNDTY